MQEKYRSEEITNSLEGPKNKISLELSFDEYLSEKISQRRTWFYKKVLEAVPAGELNEALTLAIREQAERDNSNEGFRFGPSLVEGSSRYGFRCFRRRSDGQPLAEHPDSTYVKTQNAIFEFGIDNPSGYSAGMIMPAVIWDMFLIPTEVTIYDNHEDISTILIYRNTPFVLPTVAGQEFTNLINLNEEGINSLSKPISLNEARNKQYPTLRDNLLGQIEVRWITKSTESNQMVGKKEKWNEKIKALLTWFQNSKKLN